MIGWQTIKDRMCFPLLAFLSSDHARALSLTPIDEERVAITLEHCRGAVLDLGCGMNELARGHRLRGDTAIGVDVYPWPGTDVVCDTAQLPFSDRHFDTVTMLACLNHVPQSKRMQVLQDARRVLKDEGQLLITMINPVVGVVVHAIRQRYDPDQLERGMKEEESAGLWESEVQALLSKSHFRLTETIPFVFGLNRLYVAKKDSKDSIGDNR